MLIKITDQRIQTEEALRAVHHPTCGAVSSFEGVIRSKNDGKDVIALKYEVYDSLLYAEVERIVTEIRKKWPIHELAVIQRRGRLEVGETGIFITVSSAHRRAALEACGYAIEEFKKRAPVWKKEYYASGSEWIFCHQRAS